VPLEDDKSKNLVILVLNSCKLMCKSLSNKQNKDACSKQQTTLDSEEVIDHFEWLEYNLQKYSSLESTRWLAVTIHHPFTTEPGLKKHALPLMQKYNVDLLLVGHTHMSTYTVIG